MLTSLTSGTASNSYTTTATDSSNAGTLVATAATFAGGTNESAENGSDSRVMALKLYNGTTLLDSKVPTSGKVHFELDSNELVVAKDASVVLTVKADLNPINNGTDTSKKLAYTLYAVEAESDSTNNALTTIAGNVAVTDTIAAMTDAPH
jgi:hypothetical protein